MLKNKILIILKSQVFLIFILALIIRLFYITLDYPFVLHPDEPTVVNSTINLRYNPNPMHFDWPTFYYYFTFPFFYLFEKIYFLSNDLGIIKTSEIETINYYLLSRFLTTFFGAGTAVLVYFILKNLKVPNNLALIGSCIMAIIPFHVTRSAQALTDVPMVFFAALSIYFLTKIIDKFEERYFLIACFFAGLSVSTKYNGYMIFLSLGLFLIFFRGIGFKDIYLYIKSGFISFFGFFVGTPYAVFDYETFLITDSPKGALWQFQNVGKVTLGEQFSQLFNNLFIQNYSVTGYIPLACSLLFIGFFIFKKDFLKKNSLNKFLLILVVQFLFIFWSVSGVETQRSHYLILTYLFMPIFTIFLLDMYLKHRFSLQITYLITVVACTYSLYLRINDVAVVSLYNRLEVTGDKKNLLVSYNNKDIEKVLEKLDISNVRFNPNSQSFSSKVTHVISTTDVCLKMKKCSFDLIDKIESKADSEVIYVFKRK